MNRLRSRLALLPEVLASAYWFLPALMLAAAVALAWGALKLDAGLVDRVPESGLFFTASPEGVRVLLSTVAGSMIGTAGVTFSVTMVALSMASSQLGSRLLDNFLRDRGNQLVLGALLATFVYCLLVLRAVRSVQDSSFVPFISAQIALALGLVSAPVLVFFFHHVSSSMNAEHVVALVARDLERAVDRLYPRKRWAYSGLELTLRSDDDLPAAFLREARPLPDSRSGYLQAVDTDTLLSVAGTRDAILRLEHRPGDFVAPDQPLVSVWPADRLDEELSAQVRGCLRLGTHPSRSQDVEYEINQLVAIAVRALSPAINDPFLAMSCVDRLGAALVRLAQRRIPSGYRYDDRNRLRLIVDSVTFEQILDASFNQIRQFGVASVAVTLRVLETLGVLAGATENERELQAVLRQARMLQAASLEIIREKGDRADMQRRYRHVLRTVRELTGAPSRRGGKRAPASRASPRGARPPASGGSLPRAGRLRRSVAARRGTGPGPAALRARGARSR